MQEHRWSCGTVAAATHDPPFPVAPLAKVRELGGT
jgi:hypothetical protein